MPLVIFADPKEYDADLDPSFHFDEEQDPKPETEMRLQDPSFNIDVDPDPTFNFNGDPDPANHQNYQNLLPLVHRPNSAPFLSLPTSTVSIHGPP